MALGPTVVAVTPSFVRFLQQNVSLAFTSKEHLITIMTNPLSISAHIHTHTHKELGMKPRDISRRFSLGAHPAKPRPPVLNG